MFDYVKKWIESVSPCPSCYLIECSHCLPRLGTLNIFASSNSAVIVDKIKIHTVLIIRNATRCFLIFYIKSWSNRNSNDSFGICMSWGFQNTSYILDLIRFWLSNLKFNTLNLISKLDIFSSKLKQNCLEALISQSFLCQIQKSGTV